jgi:hypothetical protein
MLRHALMHHWKEQGTDSEVKDEALTAYRDAMMVL